MEYSDGDLHVTDKKHSQVGEAMDEQDSVISQLQAEFNENYRVEHFTPGDENLGSIWEPKLRNGKIGKYNLVAFTCFNDPHDMVEHGWYNLIGWSDEKPIHECTFREYMEIYR